MTPMERITADLSAVREGKTVTALRGCTLYDLQELQSGCLRLLSGQTTTISVRLAKIYMGYGFVVEQDGIGWLIWR